MPGTSAGEETQAYQYSHTACSQVRNRTTSLRGCWSSGLDRIAAMKNISKRRRFLLHLVRHAETCKTDQSLREHPHQSREQRHGQNSFLASIAALEYYGAIGVFLRLPPVFVALKGNPEEGHHNGSPEHDMPVFDLSPLHNRRNISLHPGIPRPHAEFCACSQSLGQTGSCHGRTSSRIRNRLHKGRKYAQVL